MKLKFSPQALADIRFEQAWWKANRPKSPGLLAKELRRAFELIKGQPNIGQRALDLGAEGIRRYYLRGTKRHLYYSVRDEDVEVLRLWHAQSAKPPKM